MRRYKEIITITFRWLIAFSIIYIVYLKIKILVNLNN